MELEQLVCVGGGIFLLGMVAGGYGLVWLLVYGLNYAENGPSEAERRRRARRQEAKARMAERNNVIRSGSGRN